MRSAVSRSMDAVACFPQSPALASVLTKHHGFSCTQVNVERDLCTSSRITTGLLLSTALAKPMSWRWPWLRLRPPVSICVSSFHWWLGLSQIFRRTASHSVSVWWWRGSRFWRRVPGKRRGSWARKVCGFGIVRGWLGWGMDGRGRLDVLLRASGELEYRRLICLCRR